MNTPDQIIVQFAQAIANQLQRNLDALHPHARIIVTGPFATNNPDSFSPLLNQWLLLGDAAASTLPRTDENIKLIRRTACEFIDFVFGTGTVPDWFHDRPMGKILDAARCWAEGDELMALSAAASEFGVTVAAISQNPHLTQFINPHAPKHQGRRLVLRRECVEYYQERKR